MTAADVKSAFNPAFVVQIVVMVFLGGAAYTTLDQRGLANASNIAELKMRLDAKEVAFAAATAELSDEINRLRETNARNDERLTNILTVLGRIEARLDRQQTTHPE